jgi:L-ribulose-5-phosphate 3-epimerase
MAPLLHGRAMDPWAARNRKEGFREDSNMKKGICHGCFPADMALDERMALAEQAGFDGYELIVARAGEAELHVDCGLAELNRIKQMAADHSLELPSMYGSPVTNQYPITSPDDRVWEQGIQAVERMLDIAQVLGIDTLLYVPGRVDGNIPYDVAYERAMAALKRLAPSAEKHDVVIAVENVGNRFLLSPLEMRDFVDHIGHPFVRIYFDVGNPVLLRSAPPEHWIHILGDRIHRVHLKDGVTVGRTTLRVMLLAGEVNWPAVMGACKDVGYDSYMTAEVGAYPHYPRKSIHDISAAMDILFSECR